MANKVRDPRMKGHPWLVPHLTVRDVEKALAFYGQAFGFGQGLCVPGRDGKIMHAELTYEGETIVMLGPERGQEEASYSAPASTGAQVPVSLYVYTREVDALCRQARALGAEVLHEPGDMFWGDRITELRDPDGYRWTFAQNIRDFDPARIPQSAGNA